MIIDPKKVEIIKEIYLRDLESYPQLHSTIVGMNLENVESYYPKFYCLVKAGNDTFVVKCKYLRKLYQNTPVRGKRIPFIVDWGCRTLRFGYAPLYLMHKDKLQLVREYVGFDGNVSARLFRHEKGLVCFSFINAFTAPKTVGCFYEIDDDYDFKRYTEENVFEEQMKWFLKNKHNAWAEKTIKPLCKIEIEEFKSYPLVVMPKGIQWLEVYRKLKKGENVVLYQEQTCYDCNGPSWSHFNWNEVTSTITITLQDNERPS